MENKEKENEIKPVSYDFHGDTLIQLQDGRILSYFFQSCDIIKIYDKDTFKEVLKINLGNILQNNKDINFFGGSETVGSIIQLKNNLILIGYYNYLIEINLYEKTFESNIVYEGDRSILNINELSTNKILLITSNKILVLDKDNNKYIEKENHILKNDWKIVPISFIKRHYGDFSQYYSSTILPFERLLLCSFSEEYSYHGGCGTHPPERISKSKFIFINLKDFKEIKSTEVFKAKSNSIVCENKIIIQYYNNVYIYDINTLEEINKKEYKQIHSQLIKYDNNYLISYSKYENDNNLSILKIEGNDLIQTCEVKNTFRYKENIGWNGYPVYDFYNKILFILNDKRVIMICHGVIYCLNLNLD